MAAVCVPVLAGCATTFGSPTRHAIANLQAASVDVTPDLKIDGLIVALPNDSTAEQGGVAYIEFNVTNLSGQTDELQNASATASAPQTIGASASPSPSSVASQSLPVGSTTIPAKTSQAPGTARIVVALTPLTQPLRQGESVEVTLQFAKGGSVSDVVVPVQGSDAVGSSFLPSNPPSVPSSPSPSSVAPGSQSPGPASSS